MARYGGDEFAALLPQTDATAARIVAERVCKTLEHSKIGSDGVTLSIGVAEYPIDGNDAEALVFSADNALYVAKEGGRNRVVLARDIVDEK